MKYISAAIISVFSFLIIMDYDIYPKGAYDKSLDFYRLFTPGLIFSLYLVVLHRKLFRIGKLIRFLTIFLVYYLIAIWVGLASWGVGVPVVGALGGLIVKWLFYNRGEYIDLNHKDKLLDNEGFKFASIGFITGLVGLIFYYSTNDIFADGIGFGVIIILWQLAVGVKCIKKVSRTIIP